MSLETEAQPEEGEAWDHTGEATDTQCRGQTAPPEGKRGPSLGRARGGGPGRAPVGVGSFEDMKTFSN